MGTSSPYTVSFRVESSKFAYKLAGHKKYRRRRSSELELEELGSKRQGLRRPRREWSGLSHKKKPSKLFAIHPSCFPREWYYSPLELFPTLYGHVPKLRPDYWDVSDDQWFLN